jgi:outer membrane cobalamin receptor
VSIVAFGESPSGKYKLYGCVRDSITMTGLPYASVQLLNTNNKVIKGVMTDIEGNYIIDEIKEDRYKLVASYMGYLQSEKTILINGKETKTDFQLQPKTISLEAYELTAEKRLMVTSVEKTTINVAKNLTLTEGSAINVMTSLPSVDIDIDGNLSYRGSDKVTVLINGQRSELTKILDQIPAHQIEKVEIINNPSAKHEADGMSGIINIVMKSGRNKKNSTTIQLNAGLAETYGGNIGFNQVRDKSAFYISGGYQRKTKFQTKEHLRSNYEAPEGLNYYQFDRMDDVLNNAILSTSYNYFINKNQQVGVTLTGSKKFNQADRDIQYQTLYTDNSIDSESTKEINISLDNNNLDSEIQYNIEFSEEGHSLAASAHISFLDQQKNMENRHFLLENINPSLQNTTLEQDNFTSSFSVDYKLPAMSKIMIEAGYNFNTRDLSNVFSSISYNYDNNSWENDTDLENHFFYFQQINALYADLSGKWKRFSIIGGLRAEYVRTAQNGIDTDKYLDIFPSVNVSTTINQNNTIYAAFTRRINRPDIKMLNPYTDEYADIMNQHRGNPELQPEYVNSFEIGHHHTGKKLSGTIAIYYRNISQAISRVKTASNDSALVVTFINLEKARMPGVDLAASYSPYKWWNINAGVSIFNTTLIGSYAFNEVNKIMTGWNLNASSSFKFKNGIGAQVYGYYRSALPSVMGTYIHRYYFDAAVSKKMLKNKGRLVFKVSDIFNTYRYGLDLDAADINGYHYSQSNRRKNESQYFILSFVYNIDGKQKNTLPKTNFFLDSFDK